MRACRGCVWGFRRGVLRVVARVPRGFVRAYTMTRVDAWVCPRVRVVAGVFRFVHVSGGCLGMVKLGYE